MNEYYGVPTTPTSDYLAHYGVKGMKWGVRKALAKSGAAGQRALAKQYKKDLKHLTKLTKQSISGKKYAKRAALLGAGAAAAGTAAAVGTLGVAKGIGAAGQAFSKGAKGAGGLMQRVGGAMTRRGIRGGGRITAAGQVVSGLGKHNASGIANAVKDWGGKKTIAESVSPHIHQALNKTSLPAQTRYNLKKATVNTTNSGYARIGAATLGAGLAGAAGYNAYRALTAGRAAERARTFRNEMNKAYAGTKYDSSKKRRR